jgi:putative hemin transport protein
MKTTTDRSMLAQNFKKLINDKPNLRTRDAAAALKSSEAELLASGAIDGVKLLKADPQMLLERLKRVGKVMSLTRNEDCILEHKGNFQSVNVTQNEKMFMGLTIGEIELRCFLKEWKYFFSVTSIKKDEESHSIQVFDKAGVAIIKIFEQRHTDQAAFKALIDDMEEKSINDFEPTVVYDEQISHAIIDTDKFTQEWQKMTDPHQFTSLLKDYKADRFDALAAVQGVHSHKLTVPFIEVCLNHCAEEAIPIMIFTGNKGNIQIHQDIVKHIKVMQIGENKWINVLDPNFNMHLKENTIGSVWHVVKPSESGPIHSIEIFNHENKLITQLFGLRKMNNPQNEKWVAFICEHLTSQQLIKQ